MATAHSRLTAGLVSLNQNTGSTITVAARNSTGKAQWMPITARAESGFHVTAYVRAERCGRLLARYSVNAYSRIDICYPVR